MHAPEDLTNGKELDIFDSTHQKRTKYLLGPLKAGKPVALKVRELSLPLPKRYKHPVLLLVPSEAVGLEGGMFVSIPGLKSEYLPREAMTAAKLIRMGLTARASKMLIDELKKLYEVHDGK